MQVTCHTALGGWLRDQRTQRRLSIPEMAAQLAQAAAADDGLAPSRLSLTQYIRRWERGDFAPGDRWRRHYCTVLAIPPASFGGGHDPGQEFWKVAEVAVTLRISPMTVYRLIQSGDLQAIRAGRSYRVRAASVRRYQPAPGDTPPPRPPRPGPTAEPPAQPQDAGTDTGPLETGCLIGGQAGRPGRVQMTRQGTDNAAAPATPFMMRIYDGKRPRVTATLTRAQAADIAGWLARHLAGTEG
jgi:excisionase family DNA binding protein